MILWFTIVFVKLIRHTIPNWITFARLLTSPVFIFLFWLGVVDYEPTRILSALNPWYIGAALGLLILQEASDLIDGFWARRTGVVSDLGKLLDPLADTLSHMGAFLCLLWVGLLPLWLLVLMYYREAIISMLRVLMARQGIVLQARISGKIKTLSQAFAANLLVGLMLVAHFKPMIPLLEIADILTWFVGATTLFSFVDYFIAIGRKIDQTSSPV